VFGLGVVYVSAATLGGGSPPNNNVAGPLNVGPSYQNKSGSLDIGTFSSPTTDTGLLRVEKGFLSGGPALFNDVVVIGTPSSSQEGQAVSLNTNNQKPKGLFAKMSDFFGFGDSLKTQKALAAGSGSLCSQAGNLCIPSTLVCDVSNGGFPVNFSCNSNGTTTPDSTKKCCYNINNSIAGVCGDYNGGSFASGSLLYDYTNLTDENTKLSHFCSVGAIVTDVEYTGIGNGPWAWACDAGITGPTCHASLLAVDGHCGSAVGQTFSSTPSSNLCSTGNSTSVTGSGADTGYWKWGCNGLGSGTSTSSTACTANKTAGATPPPPTPPSTILTVYGSSNMFGGLTVSGDITSNGKGVCLKDGTNCPSSGGTTGSSLWQADASYSNHISSIPTDGFVSITSGLLKIGSGNYVLNTGASYLNSLKLDKGGTLTTPDLYGATSLTLGNNSAGASGSTGSAIKLDDSGILLQAGGGSKFIKILSTTGDVGIGVSPPIDTKLDVAGNLSVLANAYLATNGASTVGIRTTTPSQDVALQVDGGIRINSTGTKPVCSATTAGTLWFNPGTTSDSLSLCMKILGVYHWLYINVSS